MKQIPLPTDAELEILDVLWERGPSTVRDVLDRIRGLRNVGYTTVLKLLQIMLSKGLVARDDADRSHVYRATLDRVATEERLLTELADKAFGGSLERLALRALSGRPVEPGELDELRRLLSEMETT
ncbi:MAG TPA: BlaI/MecI/CopY family transcriptional regulator [Longimicrobiales bacterium]|nr:BlaI/MecI/CopY family transcriptional regulator [Longimicrobiales bacterium]